MPLALWPRRSQQRRREEARHDSEADLRTAVVLTRLEALTDRFDRAADRIDLTLEELTPPADIPRTTPGGVSP